MAQIANMLILAIILAIVIHMLFKYYKEENFKSLEDHAQVPICQMEKYKKSKKIDKIEKMENLKKVLDDKNIISGVEINNPSNFSNLSEESLLSDKKMSLDMERGETGYTYGGKINCTDCSSNNIDDHIRKSLLHKANVCKPNKKFSRKELEDYRNDFFSFNNYVNQSANYVDPVDRINELHNDGPNAYKGESIRNIYDDLTKNETNLYTRQCVRQPDIDNITKMGHYKQSGFRGNSYLRDNWIYDEEKVNNGGEFYDNIYANDPMKTQEMAIDFVK